jgi:quercetin dioxygenase-like cupin family protein
MKRKIFYIVTMLVSIMLVSGLNVSGQDVVKTNPATAKLLADTAGVRLIKTTLAPGEEMVMHTHPVQMLYCLEGGQLTVNYKSGKKETVTIKPGDAMQAPPDPPHTTKNTGTTTLSFLEIEINTGKK